MADHRLNRDSYHGTWDPRLAPRLTIQSGGTVVFETRDASNGKIRDRLSEADLSLIPFGLRDLVEADAARYASDVATPGHALTGPVAIEGAKTGDILQVDILDIEPGLWGWSSFGPGFGLLASEFTTSTRIWDMRDRAYAWLRTGIRVPIEPFCGVMGVAPDVPEPVSTIPPRAVGGNLDIKQLTPGSTLYLPITVDGGLFSVGDAHGAQGDGEVCGTGIEMESVATLRLTLRRDLAFATPRFDLPGLPGTWNSQGWYATTGHGPDLYVASQEAIRQMIAHLGDDHGLMPEDAYMVCSVAVDLKISELVDAPNWLVSAFLPKGIFG